MVVLIILVVLALIALLVVSTINRAQEKEHARRMQQRKLKLQADALVDVVTCLEQTLPNQMIAKYVNDEAIRFMQQALQLETAPSPHLESAIRHAMIHSEDLLAGKTQRNASYQRDSDAQIAQAQVHLNEATKVLRHLCAQGILTDTELEVFTSELAWAFLMVSVASYIGQGNKFAALQDRFSAQSFYQKAQNLLMESLHPDPRRVRMIRELSEIIEGSRKTMSRDLMPDRPRDLTSETATTL